MLVANGVSLVQYLEIDLAQIGRGVQCARSLLHPIVSVGFALVEQIADDLAIEVTCHRPCGGDVSPGTSLLDPCHFHVP